MVKISTDQAEALLDESATYVDVRTEEEFLDGHVPAAINVPISFMTPAGMKENEDFLRVMTATFAKDQQLIIGCKAGGRSARAVDLLEKAGFLHLFDMAAGFVGSKDPFGQPIPGWSAEGREVEIEAEEDQTYAGVVKLTEQSDD